MKLYKTQDVNFSDRLRFSLQSSTHQATVFLFGVLKNIQINVNTLNCKTNQSMLKDKGVTLSRFP